MGAEEEGEGLDKLSPNGVVMQSALTTIDPREVAHFDAQAADWWNPRGSSAMLHRLNPVRLAHLRTQIDAHWGGDPRDRRPLAGKRALDVGCGAGLLTEPLARMGAAVTGVDAAGEAIAAARAHAAAQGLAVDYRHGGVEDVDGRFDLVTAMEVIEHVADPAAFAAGLARALAPGGLLLLSTPNRTALSRTMIVTLAEGFGRIPRGTHDADRFITPDEMRALLGGAGLEVVDTTGLAWSPTRGFVLSDDLRLNYLVSAVRSETV